MPDPIEAAYFSAVLVANALAAVAHPLAPEATTLKDALAQALTHPDTIRDEPFAHLWTERGRFSQLKIDGAHAETLSKHAKILAETIL